MPIDCSLPASLRQLAAAAIVASVGPLADEHSATGENVEDRMGEIRRAALECALRGCGFASLAIFCVMFGLSFEPALALKTGGVLTALVTAILILKSQQARTQNFKRTEMWLRLPKEARPPEGQAQQIVSTVLREIYLTLALWAAAIAAVLLALALLLNIAGI
jgi:hypothetical protein